MKQEDIQFFNGIFRGSKKGFGFVEVEELDHDIFIPKQKTNTAIDGDEVLVKISEKNLISDKDGEIDRVIKRNTTKITGEYVPGNGFGFVVTSSVTFNYDVFISKKSSLGARKGDIVVCEIVKYPDGINKPEGKVIEILGQKNSVQTNVLGIIKSYDVPTDFSLKEIEEANRVSKKDMVLKNREDYTNLKVVTIDGEDSKDFDDAISCNRTEWGYRLYVHIADVSYYVVENGALDKEAYKRSNSIYTPSMVIPMLPQVLSNGMCSLNEGEIRLTMTCVMDFDKNGKLIESDIKESFIRSTHRLTYTKVDKILEGDKELRKEYSDVLGLISASYELAKKLQENREKDGMIDFGSHESKFKLNKKNEPIEVERYKEGVSNKIIEMFMVKANECVAEYLNNMELPCVYRIHEKPSGEKLELLKSFAQLIGYNFKVKVENIRTKEIQRMIKSFEGTPLFNIVNKVALRSMQKAKYSINNEGHFGLSSNCYCHFTSPIRRYSDLMVHRSLKRLMHEKYSSDNDVIYFEDLCAKAAENCSVNEKKAEQIERDTDDFFKALYMKKHIGESFEGVISGVTDFGIFVELENTVEGMVKTENLFYEKESFIYNEKMMEYKGDKHSYKIGDKVEIEVYDVDMNKRKVEFLIYD